jgi:hypothetical protein
MTLENLVLPDANGYGFCTYKLSSEKGVVVLRGIFTELVAEYLKQELEILGFHPSAVMRMRRYNKFGTPLPLILAKLLQSEKV